MGVSGGSIETSRRVVRYSLDRAEMAARKAIGLEPRLASGYTALAYVEGFRGNWAASEDYFRQTLMLDPGAPNALHLYGLMLLGAGHIRQALDIRKELRALEPFVPVYNVMTALVMQTAGQSQSSVTMLEAVPLDSAVGYYRNLYLATIHAGDGRFAQAADTLLAIPAETQQVPRRSVEDAVRLLRSAPMTVREPEALPALEAELNFVYAYIGALTRVLDAPERNLEVGLANGTVNRSVWRPIYAALRKTERFKAYVRNAGLVAYWRERGWPDLCRPVGSHDFVCD
jgi:tetratricopeptide (TPR) repeat protein